MGEPRGQSRRRNTKMAEPMGQSRRRSTKMGEPLRPPHTKGPAQVFQSLFTDSTPYSIRCLGKNGRTTWARAGTGAPK